MSHFEQNQGGAEFRRDIQITGSVGDPQLVWGPGGDQDNFAVALWQNASKYLTFRHVVGGTVFEDSLVLRSGRVGIGTNDPQTTLDVVGTIEASTGITIAGVPVASSTDTFWNSSAPDIFFATGSAAVGTATPDGRITALRTDAGNVIKADGTVNSVSDVIGLNIDVTNAGAGDAFGISSNAKSLFSLSTAEDGLDFQSYLLTGSGVSASQRVVNASFIASAGLTSGETAVVRAQATPNAGDSAGHTYISFNADDIGGAGSAVKAAFAAGTGYGLAFLANSGNMIFSEYAPFIGTDRTTDGAGFDLTLGAGDGVDSGAVARAGGSLNIHGGSPVNAGAEGNVLLGWTGSSSVGRVGVLTGSPLADLHVAGDVLVDTSGVFTGNVFANQFVGGGSLITGLDHGNMAGLSDDDHTQYLNETRHDALPSDNPHTVTFTQAVAADGSTNITGVEAETLTTGGNADGLHAHATLAHAATHVEGGSDQIPIATSGVGGIIGAQDFIHWNDQVSTGLLGGGEIVINGGDSTKFDVPAGDAVVVDSHTDPQGPVVTHVSWTDFTAVTPVGLGVTTFTYVAINSAGVLVQQTIAFTEEQRRDLIVIGRLFHRTGAAIDIAISVPLVAFGRDMDVLDFMSAIGSVNINGNVYGPNDSNLKINKSSGKTFRIGANYSTSKKTVSTTNDPAVSGSVIIYTYQDGSGGFAIDAPVTDVDPTQYDDGDGVLAAVPSGSYTLQPIVFFAQSNTTAIQYGQALFTTLELAEQQHTEDTSAANPDLEGGTIRGWIALKWDATDLSDVAQATFITAGKFGVAGSATGAASGETNTASNVGVGGVGPFKAKVGADLQFKNINSSSSNITITDDTANDEIDIGFVPFAQTVHVAISGGDFTSIKTALDSITDASVSKPYTIQVHPGIYTEDNSAGALTIKDYVTISSVDSPQSSTIQPTTTTNDMFTFDTLGASTLRGISIQGVASAAAISISSGIQAIVAEIMVSACQTGMLVSGAGVRASLLNASFTNCNTGIKVTTGAKIQALGVGIRAAAASGIVGFEVSDPITGGGESVLTNIDIRGMLGGSFATGAWVHTSGHIESRNLHVHDATDGLLIDSDAVVEFMNMGLEDCTNGLRIGPLGTISDANGVGLTVVDSTSKDIKIENTTDFKFTLQGGRLDKSKVDSPTVGTFIATYVDRLAADEALVIDGELHVGDPDMGHESVFGEGDSYVKDIQVHQYDASASSGSRFTDVTANAKFIDGNTIGFPAGAGLGDALVFAAPRKFWGLKTNIPSIPLIPSLSGAIWEVYGVNGWEIFNVMETDADSPFDSNANAAFEESGSHQIRFDSAVEPTFSGVNNILDDIPNYGSDHFAVRSRLQETPTQVPLFQQTKFHTSRTEINADGTIEYMGKARPFVLDVKEQGSPTFNAGASTPTNGDIYISPNVFIEGAINSFLNNAEDILKAQWHIPLNCDTSRPLEVTIVWSSNVTSGNVEWEILYAFSNASSLLGFTGTDVTGVPDFRETSIVPVPAVAFTSAQTTLTIDISDRLPGDTLNYNIIRDASAGNADDTAAGDARMKEVRFRYLSWKL